MLGLLLNLLCCTAPPQESDPSAWLRVPVPGVWEDAGHEEFRAHDGFAWYRAVVRVPGDWAGRAIELHLGHLDDCDETFLNGVRVGASGSLPPAYASATSLERVYRVAPKHVRYGAWNLIAIRVWDGGGRGGFKGAAPLLVCGGEALDLAGIWELRTGDDLAWGSWPAEEEAETLALAFRRDNRERPGRGGVVRLSSSWRERVERGLALTPEQALDAFEVTGGFDITLAAGEPDIVQPVEVKFDERGRMWVVQYVQYMYPAGLEPLSKDEFDRTVYDRVPEPPPQGPRGADRITICEDTDGDGRYDRFKDFVSGLNLATSVAFGFGGVWVAQTPYLLFYPDRDRDDVPDGDPEVVLSGFGMEDAHAVVNSLTWGPDGWLYGAQGSTCTAHVRGQVFQQAAWRYHPNDDRFEVFAEGGGNTFGLELDAHGELFTGTNWGEHVLVHYVQGGYYFKNFGKHGPLSNPHAYGHFDHCPHEGEAVGHVCHVGVLVQGDAYPTSWDGAWIAAHLLGNRISVHDVLRDGSSFRTRFRQDLLTTPDRWFRPVDLVTGPDEALWIADWYDRRATHLIPVDDWDKASGRIWRVAPRRTQPYAPVDLAELGSRELVDLLGTPSVYHARTALRLLDERNDPVIRPILEDRLWNDRDPIVRLRALWALHAGGDLDQTRVERLLRHPDEYVRAWTVRLAGDAPSLAATVGRRLALRATHEQSVVVRSQLAATARRLPQRDALALVDALLQRSEDARDPHVPLLVWWAVESIVDRYADTLVHRLTSRPGWLEPMTSRHVLPRLVRRLASTGEPRGLVLAARVLRSAPGPASAAPLLRALDEALAGRAVSDAPAELRRAVDEAPVGGSTELRLLQLKLGLRLWSERSHAAALVVAADPEAAESLRLGVLSVLGEVGRLEAITPLFELARDDPSSTIRRAALSALRRFDDERIPRRILRWYTRFAADPEVRRATLELLASRRSWARALLAAVEEERVPFTDVPASAVAQIRRLEDAELDAALALRWGDPRRSSAEKRARIAKLEALLAADSTGDAELGRALFTEHCARCHRLFGEGEDLGPDLTGYERDLEFLLLSIVDPSAAIREPWHDFVLETNDGLVLTGFVIAETAEAVTLEDADRQRTTVARAEIRSLRASPVSRMPESLLEPLGEDGIRALLRYLRGDGR